jgi:hypothetical protein
MQTGILESLTQQPHFVQQRLDSWIRIRLRFDPVKGSYGEVSINMLGRTIQLKVIITLCYCAIDAQAQRLEENSSPSRDTSLTSTVCSSLATIAFY